MSQPIYFCKLYKHFEYMVMNMPLDKLSALTRNIIVRYQRGVYWQQAIPNNMDVNSCDISGTANISKRN